MAQTVKIPWEILSRFDDVSFECPGTWQECTDEQKQRVVEECNHVVSLVNDGDSWYGRGLSAYNIKRSCESLLRKVSEKGGSK